MAELAGLKKQRAINKGKLTNIIKFANEADMNTPLEQITVRLNRIEKLMQEFTDLESSILQIDVNEPADNIYEDNYYNAVAGLNTLIRERNLSVGTGILNLDSSQNATQFGVRSEVKLPKIHIPSFSGEYSEWQSFYDLYTATIHEAPSLNAVQKFQYLKGLLRGEAAVLLRHINVTESNYIGALNKLKERYDRKKHIINSFIRTFMEQAPIHTSSAAQIKRLMDTSDEVIRGLKALGDVAETRDPWLIYILMNKLDDKSKALWAEQAADIDNPDFNRFLKFLARRIDTLESLNTTSKRGIVRTDIKAHVATSQPKSSESRLPAKEYQFECAMCKDKNHTLFQCNDFHTLDVKEREDFTKQTKRCRNCLSTRHPIFKCPSRRRCQNCGMKHHTLLHQDQKVDDNRQSQETTASNHATALQLQKISVTSILPTAIVKVLDASGELIPCRALLDSGSQASFVTESCAQRLHIKKRNARVCISGLGQTGTTASKGVVSITIMPDNSPELKINALVMPKITSQIPQQNLDFIKINSKITLADPEFYKKGEIDILVGADHFFNIIRDGQIRTTSNGPIMQNTIFGWIVSGQIKNNRCDHTSSMLATTTQSQEIVDIDKSLKRFWELDSINDHTILSSPEETFCENHFKSNLQRNTEGRFVVRLPFKESPASLGQSLPAAIQRLRGIERRLNRDTNFAKLYKEFLSEYKQLNHMTEIPPEEVTNSGYYIPHHGVFKASGTTAKLRVVFDGSAKSDTDISLNDCLAVGPTVQSTLFAIILRFREHKVVFSTDVQKMYRQIIVSSKDTQFQKIVWREDPSKPIQHYKLNTVTYGLASSAFLATRAIKQISDENKSMLPNASYEILKNMYVDDLMTGADTEDQLLQLQEEIIALLASYGFQLSKWMSNCGKILEQAPNKLLNSHFKELHDRGQELNNSAKVLGVMWNSKSDYFCFTSELPNSMTYTKRTVLSEASRIFDPLGWLAPVVIKTKILMQMLWEDKLEWDDPLPPKRKILWGKIRKDLNDITSITVPRYIQTTKECKIDIHGFCDASQLAYAAVVYYKVVRPDGKTITNIVTAKTKVAPIKQQTLPRLELCAAVLLTNLINIVLKETQLKIENIYAWSDSQIVLDWLGSNPKRWSTFVGNRTAEILSSLPRQQWNHVPSADNPADCATRGLSPSELRSYSLWWTGPDWLHKSSEFWPHQIIQHTKLEEKNNKSLTLTILLGQQDEFYDLMTSKYSSFRKLQRVLCYIYRFTGNAAKVKSSRLDGVNLRREELLQIQYKLCKKEQVHYFQEEITSLQATGEVSKTSSLKSLNPFVDGFGILRVGGRLQNSLAPYSTKHPIILHSKSNITALILHDVHRDNMHATASLLLSLARQEYWIPNGKSKAKEIVRKCVICSKFKAQCQQQLMGNLPSSRVQLIQPFLKTGVDYAGPIAIHLAKGRGQKTYKAYICIFVCLSTKAVHLELVGDLTSDAFLGALKRFTARRGVCQELHSDNGTNFIGADAKLRAEFDKVIKQSNNISDFFSRHRITWHFIPPNAPHFGGIWEAAVKSTKFHLKRVIGKHILTLEEMNTLLIEIEAILNSRPLCSSSATDIDPLTPSHFLLGRPATKIPELDITHLKISHLTRWQLVQQIKQHFWKRWYIEYLTSLQQRSKWTFKHTSVKIGDIVIIKENNLPINQWLLGKVTNTHPGSDGIVRVATIKTKNSELKRPIHKLCILPVAHTEPDDTNTTNE